MTWLTDPAEHPDHDHVGVSLYRDPDGEPWVVLLLTPAGQDEAMLPLPPELAQQLVDALQQAIDDRATLVAGGTPDWAADA